MRIRVNIGGLLTETALAQVCSESQCSSPERRPIDFGIQTSREGNVEDGKVEERKSIKQKGKRVS